MIRAGDARAPIPGNTDPWAGPVDPAAQARWEQRHRRDVTSWQAKREQREDSCGCWMRDCAECGALLGDGQRPQPGSVARRARRVDAGVRRG